MAFKIYTKTGDLGQTALFGGRRVSKSDLRVDAYGTVDELNAFVGALRDACTEKELNQVLAFIQHRLFSLGAQLASDPEKTLPTPELGTAEIQRLEAAIDEMDAQLAPLTNFILPGGHPTVSLCHICRTVCRRAERLVVALGENDRVPPVAIQFLNRLSDYFFVLARFLCLKLGVSEVLWNKD